MSTAQKGKQMADTITTTDKDLRDDVIRVCTFIHHRGGAISCEAFLGMHMGEVVPEHVEWWHQMANEALQRILKERRNVVEIERETK